MAEVVLAECNGSAWLVQGVEHIDDLLNNTMPADITIAVVACESKSAVDDLWRAANDEPPDVGMWLIHPAIVRRARGQSGPASVTFAEWSAALDDAAQGAIAAAAAGLPAGATLALVRFVDDGAPAMAADLANVRLGLIEARLAALGVIQTERQTRKADQPGQADRIELAVKPAT